MQPEPAKSRKRARTGGGGGDRAIFFKAYNPPGTNPAFEKLSNLFGTVEWQFQRAKFRQGSAVYEWLTEGLHKTRADEWTREEFAAALRAMGHTGKVESYVAADGQLATGLLAQFTTEIAQYRAKVAHFRSGTRKSKPTLGRTRLSHILKRPMSEEDTVAWCEEYVKPPLEAQAARELMLRLLREKYICAESAVTADPRLPEYQRTLRATGDCVLHEAKGRGKPSKWEYVQLTRAQADAGFESGGDLLGALLAQVRTQLPRGP